MMHLNYVAIVGAAVVAFAIGGLWYSPFLFAGAWQRAHGYTREKMAAMKAANPPARAMAVTFLCQLVTAFAMAVLIWWMAFEGWYEGMLLSILVWGGFVATTGLMTNMFSDKPLRAWLIDAGYQLVYFVAMGLIIGFWR
jgi:hypothetical protein